MADVFRRILTCPHCNRLMLQCMLNTQCMHRTCTQCINRVTYICFVCEQRPDRLEYPSLAYDPGQKLYRDPDFEQMAAVLHRDEYVFPASYPNAFWETIWRIAMERFRKNRIRYPREYYALLVAKMAANETEDEFQRCQCGIPSFANKYTKELGCPCIKSCNGWNWNIISP